MVSGPEQLEASLRAVFAGFSSDGDGSKQGESECHRRDPIGPREVRSSRGIERPLFTKNFEDWRCQPDDTTRITQHLHLILTVNPVREPKLIESFVAGRDGLVNPTVT